MSNKRAALYVRVSTDAQTARTKYASFGKSRSGGAGK